MKTIAHHIEHIRTKPDHIRKQVALGVAAGVTALVALVWFVSTVAAGAFVIQGSSFAESASGSGNVATVGPSEGTGLAGVAAAALGVPGPEPAHIEIVDTKPAAVATKKPEQTVIPF